MNEKSELRFKRLYRILTTLLCFFLSVIIVLGFDFRDPPPVPDYVKFIDVGQGDCILIKSGDYAALIDAGTAYSAQKIMQSIKKSGVNRLDALIITHPHSDHFGSAAFLLSQMKVDNIVIPSSRPNDSEEAVLYDNFLNYGIEGKIPFYSAAVGTVIKIGNVDITVLQCDDNAVEENDRSVILMAESDGVKFLLMGDAGIYAENRLLQNGINVDCDVLKVGHHGSSDSSSADFLKRATPEYAVISVGETNSYGHPHKEAMLRIVDSSATVVRTDLMGDIEFTVLKGYLDLMVS